MTDKKSSRTLADVLDALQRADMPEKRRGELASALRTVGRVLNRPLDQIPVESGPLRRRLDDVSPIAIGMSAGRWANVRSLLRAALDLVKQELPAVRRKPMSPVWANLFGRLSKASRIRVSRLLRFFSELSVEPDAVAPDHFEQFRQMLEGDALIRKPNQVWREAIGVWNSSRHKISGWPSIEIVAASRRDTFSLPWSAFPESFKADADAYLARISGSDLLDDLPFRPVRPGTRQTREYQSRAAASALVRRGRAPETIRSLSDLVELGAFKEILRFFMTRRGNKTSAGIEHLANFLKSVARHWVKVDTATLQKMSDTIKNHISMPNSGMTPKNRERLRPFDDEENVYALLNLPAHLMREAVSGRHSKIRSAILAQLAVAIELELVRPLRISNLAALELYRHILQRTNGSWYITIPEDEVKNRIDLEHDLPVEASTLLERYLKDFRPLLAKPGNAALFPGDLGCKAKNTLGGQLTKIIHAYTGLKMHPHLFRHFGSCEYLKEHPGEYPVISHVLGHKSLNTAAKSYTGMESAAAVRHFGKTIIKKLQELPSRGNDAHRAWRRKKPKSDPKGGKN